MLNRCAQQLGGFRLMRIGGKVVNTSPMPSDRGGGRRFARTIDLRRWSIRRNQRYCVWRRRCRALIKRLESRLWVFSN